MDEPAVGGMGEGKSAMEEVTRYNEELRRLDKMLKPFLLSFTVVDLDILHRGLNLVETVGPLFTPSEWMYGGARNVEQQRKFIKAVTPLVTYAKSLLPAPTPIQEGTHDV